MAYGAGLRRSGGECIQNVEFEMLMRDSGMSGVFAGYQAKSRMVGNYESGLAEIKEY